MQNEPKRRVFRIPFHSSIHDHLNIMGSPFKNSFPSFIVVSLILISLVLLEAQAQFPLIMTKDSRHYFRADNPNHISMYQLGPDGNVVARMNISVAYIVEREKSVPSCGVGSNNTIQCCLFPDIGISPISTDPSYGTLLQYIDFSTLNCSFAVNNITNVPGISLTQLESDCSGSGAFQDFNFNSSLYLTNETYSYILSNVTTYSSGQLLPITFDPDALKLQYRSTGWPWMSNSSFISMHFNFSMELINIPNPTNISFTADILNVTASIYDGVFLDISSTWEAYSFLNFTSEALNANKSYIPITGGLSTFRPATVTISAGASLSLNYLIGVHICPYPPYSEFFYDPTLGYAFYGSIENPSSPPSSQQAKDRTGAIVASAVSVGIVIIAVGAIVILWNKWGSLNSRWEQWRRDSKLKQEDADLGSASSAGHATITEIAPVHATNSSPAGEYAAPGSNWISGRKTVDS